MIPSWIHMSQTAGAAGHYTITITADTNSQIEERLASLSVSGNYGPMVAGANIIISQKGRMYSNSNKLYYKTIDDIFDTSYFTDKFLDIDGNPTRIISHGGVPSTSKSYVVTTEKDIYDFSGERLIPFLSYNRLSQVTIPPLVQSIPEIYFASETALTSCTIGFNCERIDKAAFYNCSSLTTIICKAVTPPSLVSDSFELNPYEGILYVPAGCRTAYEEGEYWWDDSVNSFKTREWNIAEFAFDNYPIWLGTTDAWPWHMTVNCSGNTEPLNVSVNYIDFGRGVGVRREFTITIPAGEGINTVTTILDAQDFDGDYNNDYLSDIYIAAANTPGEYSVDGYHYYLDYNLTYDGIAAALEDVNNEHGIDNLQFGEELPLEDDI